MIELKKEKLKYLKLDRYNLCDTGVSKKNDSDVLEQTAWI